MSPLRNAKADQTDPPAGTQGPAGGGIAMRPFEESLPMALLRARESTMRAFRPLLTEHDLTEQQWRVLRALAASSGPMDVGAIATQTFLLGSSLSRILANLERRDLVGRSTPAGDRRSYLIDLTAAGHRLMARFSPRGEAAYAQIEQQFGTDRLGRLLAELHDLANLDFTGSAGEPGET